MNEIAYIQEFCTGCGLCHSTGNTNLIKNDRGYFVPQISHGGGTSIMNQCARSSIIRILKSLICGAHMNVSTVDIHLKMKSGTWLQVAGP